MLQEHIRHHSKQYKELEEIAAKSLPKKRRKLNAGLLYFEEVRDLAYLLSKYVVSCSPSP